MGQQTWVLQRVPLPEKMCVVYKVKMRVSTAARAWIAKHEGWVGIRRELDSRGLVVEGSACSVESTSPINKATPCPLSYKAHHVSRSHSRC